MFTDMKEALEAEALELTPLDSDQHTAASLVVAHHARDKDDLADLLGALGLPCDEDDLVRLLPHLTTPDDTPTGDTMPTEAPNAFTATAASMLKDGDSPEHVRDTLGLSEEELADALKHADADSATTDLSQAASSQPGSQTDPGNADRPTADSGIEALLTWGEQHDTKGVQALAARARSALADLAQRRDTEHAVADAESKVGKLESELARAREALRQAKNGKPAAPAPAAQTAIARRRTKDELAAIRTWARSNGHQVADRGLPAQAVLDAYDAAHRANLAEAS